MEFSKDFFKREVKCGFEIPEMMKRAWAAELEVLEVVKNVCEKNNIQYFADWGTLLGAVRHQGFIPWDDDIDICLKREEYNRLIKVLPRDLPEGFVMAGMYAGEERLRRAAFVPQIRVMADETKWNFNDYMRYFHGFPYQRIGIDIFPLDYLPRNAEVRAVQETIVRAGLEIIKYWNPLNDTNRLEEKLQEFEKCCGITIPRDNQIQNRIWRTIDAVIATCYENEADEVTNYFSWLKRTEFHIRKEWYQDVKYLMFEGRPIPVPGDYDAVLKAKFGDYMVPVKGKMGHGYPFYGDMEPELKKQIRAVGFNGTVEEFCEAVSTGKLSV